MEGKQIITLNQKYKKLGYNLMDGLSQHLKNFYSIDNSTSDLITLPGYSIKFITSGKKPYSINLYKGNTKYLFELDLTRIIENDKGFTWYLNKPSNPKSLALLKTDPLWTDHIPDDYLNKVKEIRTIIYPDKMPGIAGKVGCGLCNNSSRADMTIMFINKMKAAVDRHIDSVKRDKIEIEINKLGIQIEDQGVFDPNSEEDARTFALTSIAMRRGQSEFRKKLLKAYENKCAITGSDVEAALEAAHISAYKGDHTNPIENGLLLRADIHTLFDIGLIAINSNNRVVFHESLIISDHYSNLNNRRIFIPKCVADRPNKEALALHKSNSKL